MHLVLRHHLLPPLTTDKENTIIGLVELLLMFLPFYTYNIPLFFDLNLPQLHMRPKT